MSLYTSVNVADLLLSFMHIKGGVKILRDQLLGSFHIHILLECKIGGKAVQQLPQMDSAARQTVLEHFPWLPGLTDTLEECLYLGGSPCFILIGPFPSV